MMLVSCNTYPSGAVHYSYAFYGQGVGPIHVDNLYCLGSEYRVSSCSYDNDTSEDSHSDDWSIRCPRGEQYESTTGFVIDE